MRLVVGVLATGLMFASSARAAVTPFPVPTAVADLAYSADGRLLAIVTNDVCTRFAVEAVGAGGALTPVALLRGCVSGGGFAPGATRLSQFTNSGAKSTVDVRDLASETPTFSAHVPYATLDTPHVFWSPDGRRMLTESEGATSVFDATVGRRLRTLSLGSSYVGRQPFSPRGDRVVARDRRGVALISVSNGHRRVLPLPSNLDRPAWSPDGRLVAGTGGHGVAWATAAGRRYRTVHLNGVLEVAWSPDSRLIAAYRAGPGDRWSIWIIDASSAKLTRIASFRDGADRGELAWSTDGRRLAFQTSDSA